MQDDGGVGRGGVQDWAMKTTKTVEVLPALQQPHKSVLELVI